MDQTSLPSVYLLSHVFHPAPCVTKTANYACRPNTCRFTWLWCLVVLCMPLVRWSFHFSRQVQVNILYVVPTELDVSRFEGALSRVLQLYPHAAGQLRHIDQRWLVGQSPGNSQTFILPFLDRTHQYCYSREHWLQARFKFWLAPAWRLGHPGWSFPFYWRPTVWCQYYRRQRRPSPPC